MIGRATRRFGRGHGWFVAFDVRPGNPKGIQNWNDLTQPGLQILTPDPAQSGGARWNIVGAYGAAMRGEVPGYDGQRPGGAQRAAGRHLQERDACSTRAPTTRSRTSKSGNGDVAITYENQAARRRSPAGSEDRSRDPAVDRARSRHPTVVVDANAEKHCVAHDRRRVRRVPAHARRAGCVLQLGGLPAADPRRCRRRRADGSEYPPVQDLFTTDDLGGWDKLIERYRVRPERRVHQGLPGSQGLATIAVQATVQQRSSARSRLRPGAALGRWSLRGIGVPLPGPVHPAAGGGDASERVRQRPGQPPGRRCVRSAPRTRSS